ncbi:hypothetical protein [Pseudomonas oryzihabitans]|uniref:hypothetical protein n=1 Tax=Pseudomonas oryzihabitans TaxID=47885 RepID=UPI00289E66F7|nr:hypothetical protein [Pseudomonas oryzihabitans]
MNALITKVVGAFFALCLIVGLSWGWGYSVRDHKAEQEALTAKNAALVAQNEFNAQLEKERETSQRTLNEISTKWQAFLKSESRNAADTIAGLRATGVRLSVELADAKVCAVTGNCGPNANGRAELSDRASQFLVGQAQRADKQIKALQQVINAMQRNGGEHATEEGRP